ncbi:DEAD/DEAH box helicase [Acidovorax sp. HDW3]|uniref:DEAD/DEAH box helicase n=1 Tax=Acidovorax sp. HDW3 TaxID=2714923 RepID=UPI00140C97A0|nr:DEAD/DEAH box helicase [Acidovorax sp. HDW3]QIL44589.1 DEAD/DEAH box helicase [Acidovorax sp. HDW3]
MTESIALQAEQAPAIASLPVADEAVAASVVPAENTAPAPVAAPAFPEGFARLGLVPELLRAVQDLGYTEPTAVQQKAIPLAMGAGDEEGRFIDLMVSSQTGSGKTAAFLLPVLHTLVQQQEAQIARERAEFDRQAAEAAERGEAPPKRARRKNPTDARNFKAAVPGALVLCPTRELAQQVAHDAIELVKHCKGLRIANVVGGMPYQLQIAKLQNANLVVATPGRLLDLQRSMQIKLDQVQFLVVDEADRMLDLGFADDLAEINQLTAQRKQTMMFSATFAPRIQQLAMRVMHDNGSAVQKVQIDSPQEKHANIQQKLFWADNAQHKRKMLDHWLRDASINQAVVFASTQIECDGLAQDLQQDGFSAVALHGALSQGLRNRRLMALRNGQVQILVATDVAARGIDVPTITHVFNFGLPMKAEDYTHRIGRTGRAGRDGLAVTFAEFRDRRKIFDIEGYSRQQFKAETIPGLEPTQRFPQGRPEGGRGGRDGGHGRGERRFGGRSEGRDGGRGGFGDRGGFGGGDRGGDRGGFAERRPAERGGFAERRPYGDRPDRPERPAYGARRDSEGYGRKGGFGEGAQGHGHFNREGAGRGGFNDAGRGNWGGNGRADAAPRGDWGRKPGGFAKPGNTGGGKPFVPHKRPAR